VSAKPKTPETSGRLKRLLYSRQSPAPQKPATRGATVVMPVAPRSFDDFSSKVVASKVRGLKARKIKHIQRRPRAGGDP